MTSQEITWRVDPLTREMHPVIPARYKDALDRVWRLGAIMCHNGDEAAGAAIVDGYKHLLPRDVIGDFAVPSYRLTEAEKRALAAVRELLGQIQGFGSKSLQEVVEGFLRGLDQVGD